MIKVILSLIGILWFSSIAYSQDIATPIKQEDASKLKTVIVGSSTSGYKELKVDSSNRLVVYDEASGAVGTTTSNMYITDGSQWVGLKGNTSTGSAYIEIKNSNINNGVLSHPYIGCLSYATKTGTALTNEKIIDISLSQTLYILGIAVFNYSTIGGQVDFNFDTTNLCYPSTVGNTVGSGYITDTYRVGGTGQDLYITTAPTSLGITIYYIVQ